MLLTGFDAPVEQVMYLDKPLKEHNLLQAIARVNRIYKEKNYGLVVDYYGVFDNLKEALAIFNTRDVENAVTPIRDEKPRLEANYREVMRFFEGVNMDDLDECKLAFKDENKRARFKQAFKDFSKSMDIVLPDPIAEPYRDDLKKLGKIYRAVRNHYRDDNLNIKGVGSKVKRLIDEHIKASGIKQLNEAVSILDEKEFDQIINETKSKEAKASEMEHAIKEEVSVKMEENPVYYQSLRERLEEIIEKRKNGRLNINEQIKEMGEIIGDMRSVKTKAEKLGFNQKEYAVYELLLSEIERESKKDGNEGAKQTVSNGDDIQVNERIKKLTQKLTSEIKEYTEIDLWKEKSEILQKMRKRIKVNLLDYDEYKSKLEDVTTKIMQLARNIFVLL